MNFRTERINSIIRRELGLLIINELEDSQVSKLTGINQVKVAKDLSVAHVYVSAPGDKIAIETNAQRLNKHAKRLRGMLAAELDLRRTPELKFHPDMVAFDAKRLPKLIDQAAH